MYVAITRAKDRLYLIHAFRRMIYGRTEVYEASRFLRDVKGLSGVSSGPASGARQSWGAEERGRGGSSGGDRWPRHDEEEAWTPPSRDTRRDTESRAPFGRTPRAAADSSARGTPWSPGSLDRSRAEKPSGRDDRQPQFKPGDRVDHGLFGQGIVLKSELTTDDEEVTVTFAGKGTKTLLAGFAKLRKV